MSYVRTPSLGSCGKCQATSTHISKYTRSRLFAFLLGIKQFTKAAKAEIPTYESNAQRPYILMAPISQYASVNEPGLLFTRSMQLPGHPSFRYVFPAQSPQNVKLIITLCGANLDEISQFVFGKSAVGVPQPSVLTVAWPGLRTSKGTLESWRDQNQARMKFGVRSMANHPPPAALKLGPYEFAFRSSTPHPAFPFVIQ